MDYYILKDVKEKTYNKKRIYHFESEHEVCIISLREGDSFIFRNEETGGVTHTSSVCKIDKDDKYLTVETNNSIYSLELKETKVRYLNEVLDSIIGVINEDKTDLKFSLEKIKNDVFYKAPEHMHILWNEAYDVLEEEYTNPLTSEEALEVFVIFSGKSKEVLMNQDYNY